MKCSACGAENDPANRFCDQCGSQMEQAAAPAPVAAAPSTVTCPACGAVVLPGEAFCDNCGSALSNPMPATVIEAAPAAAPDTSSAPAASGSTEFPTDPPVAVTPEAAPAPAAEAVPTDPQAVPVDVAPPVAAPGDETVLASGPAMTAPAAETVTSAAPATGGASEQPATPAPADADAQYAAQKQTIEAEISRAQQVVTQLEGVQAMLGAATPAGVVQSLDEARAALSKAQNDLAALQPPAPAIDPAVLAALNDELARNQQVVTQLEGVQAALGAATPAGVVQSLDAARAAVQKTQADLAALGVAPAAAAPAPTPAADASAPTMAAPIEAAPTPTPAPTPPPVVSGPRLVFEESGKELLLPAGKNELVIGREDPISGIYPELDMTAFGGEGGGVSRQHARLSLNGSQWMLTDLNSTNHTKIDGVRLEPNIATPVNDGARVQFGRLVMVFRSA